MAHGHDHHHHHTSLRAQAAQPTLSLLRMSAGQRLATVGAVLALLWAVTALVLS